MSRTQGCKAGLTMLGRDEDRNSIFGASGGHLADIWEYAIAHRKVSECFHHAWHVKKG